jgi:predicted RNA-binding protein with PUA-like domain
MEVAPIDQRDPHGSASKRFGCVESRKPAAYDDDMMQRRTVHLDIAGHQYKSRTPGGKSKEQGKNRDHAAARMEHGAWSKELIENLKSKIENLEWLKNLNLYCLTTLFYISDSRGGLFMANRWLFKTEPSAYSFQQLQQDKKTMWDGVKNNLALKNLKDIEAGDQILIYHTGDEKAAVGMARALGNAYPDPSKKDPKLLVVDIEAVKGLPRPVPLSEIKENSKLKNFDLVRLPRLSIMKVSDEQWKIIEGMAKQ